MEITIQINGQAVSIEVSIEVYEFLHVASSLFTFSMVFVRKSMTRRPLFPRRANVTMLQDSLNVTDY